MRIVLDLQGVQSASRFRGIGRHNLSLAQAIVHNKGEHEVIVVLSGLFPETIKPIRQAFYKLLPAENIRVWYAPGPVFEYENNNIWRRQMAEFIREAFLFSLKPDIIYILSLFEGWRDDAITSIDLFDKQTPVFVTLHDLIPLLNPDKYLTEDAFRTHYLKKIEYLKQAKGLLSISDSSSREAIEALNYPPEKLHNIGSGLNSYFETCTISKEIKKIIRQRYNLRTPFLMYVGAGDVRKNINRLIESYGCLSRKLRDAHQLLIVGNMTINEISSFKKIALQKKINKNELIFAQYVTDEELKILYNLCYLLVFPSYHEGFGLPILEAMNCGVPVIGSNTSSIPEVIGREDALFDPFDEKSIATKITQVLSDKDFRADLIQHGFQQVRKFSWDKSAMVVLQVFENFQKEHQKEISLADNAIIRKKLLQSIISLEGTIKNKKEWSALAQCIAQNFPEKITRQLFFDVSKICQDDFKTGVQRVVRNLLLEWLSHPPGNFKIEAICFNAKLKCYCYARKYAANLLNISQEFLEDDVIEVQPGDVYLMADLFYSTPNIYEMGAYRLFQELGIKMYFVIHDLLPIFSPHFFPPLVKEKFQTYLKTICNLASEVICISKIVKKDLQAWLVNQSFLELDPSHMHYFHLGADINKTPSSAGLNDEAKEILHSLKGKINFLMVSTIEPRKGYTQTLAAFDLLWEKNSNINLIIVGKKGWMVEALIKKIKQHPKQGKNLFWMKGISDNYLKKLYNISSCLIAASEGEGFGLPLIEAAHHNLPIIARDIPIFREIAGEYACYFNGLLAENLAAAIQQWLLLYKRGEHLISNNMPYLSWKESAEQLLKIILEKS